MAINFPDSPTPNDTFTDGGRTWIWDGTTWKIYSSTSSGIGLSNLSVTTSSVGTAALSYNSTTGVFTYTPPDLSGYLTQQYTLPTASTTVLGGVKVDGSTITINGSGVISGASTYNDGDVDARLNTATATSGQILSWTGTDYDWVAESVPTSIAVANESTDVECFPLFTTIAIGNLAPKTVNSFKLNSQTGQVEAGSFKKTGGSSSEFLKADGSIDSTTYLSTTGVQNLQGQLVVDKVNINDNIIQVNTASDELIVRGKGVGGAAHLKLDDDVTIVGDLTVQGTASFSSGGVPIGSIIMWYGSTGTIPSGWSLCDGTTVNGYATPNLRDRFVIGAGNSYAVNATGGSTTDTVTISGSDTVNISASDNVTISGTTGTVQQTGGSAYTSMYSQANHTHSFSGSATVNITASDTVNISGSDTVNTIPP